MVSCDNAKHPRPPTINRSSPNWSHSTPLNTPHQLLTGGPPTGLTAAQRDTPAQKTAESPPAHSAYPAASYPVERLTSRSVASTAMSPGSCASYPVEKLTSPTVTSTAMSPDSCASYPVEKLTSPTVASTSMSPDSCASYPDSLSLHTVTGKFETSKDRVGLQVQH